MDHPFKMSASFKIFKKGSKIGQICQQILSSKKLPTGGGRSQKSWKFAAVLNEWSLIKFKSDVRYSKFCIYKYIEWNSSEIKVSVFIKKNLSTETWFWSYTTSTNNNFRQPEEYNDFPEDGYVQHHQPKFQSLDLEHNLRHTR